VEPVREVEDESDDDHGDDRDEDVHRRSFQEADGRATRPPPEYADQRRRS
jgi:hypothetical protein